MEDVSHWLSAAVCGVFALATTLGGTLFCLRALGVGRVRRSGRSPRSSRPCVSRNRSAVICAILYACSAAFIYTGVRAIRRSSAPTQRMQILSHPEITEAAKRHYAGDDVRKGLAGFLNARNRVLVRSHAAAMREGKRDQWRRQLIEEGREKVAILLILYPRIDDVTVQHDLLYCLQKICDIDVGLQPDSKPPPDDLDARFVKLESRWKAEHGDLAEAPTTAPAEIVGTWVGPVERSAEGETIQRELEFQADLDIRVTTYRLDANGRRTSSSVAQGPYRVDGQCLTAGVLGTRNPIRMTVQDDSLSLEPDNGPATLWKRRKHE